MALQRVFKKSYIDELRNNINVADYLQDSFPYDESRCAKLYGIQHPEGLLEKLDPTPDGDLQSAIAIYEAYKDISPLLAQQDDLWVYLTHVDLFEYVKKRWPIMVGDDVDKVKNFIGNHWFRHTKHLFRTTLAGLWWQVYLTKDETRDDPYELTKVYFNCGTDFGQKFGELSLIRHHEAMIGILEFLGENPEILSYHQEARGQFISRYFNLIGGFTHLCSHDRYFFKKELSKLKERILEVKNISDVQNKTIEY